jgi:hypothetical protein
MTTSEAGRRNAHRRVGTAAVLAFLALMLLGATHRSAQADPAAPAAAPAPIYESPGGAPDPDGGFGEHRGPGPRDGDGYGGFGRHDGDGGGGFDGGPPSDGGAAPAPSTPAPAAPAPSSGGNQT